ncbi:MAG: TIGR01244 family sulfur transferase [Pseudomonadota bacterium]
MDIRALTPDFAVSPQIEPADLPAIKAAGYKAVICNRPDAENPVELQAEVLRAATEAAGLVFIENPLAPGEMSLEHVHGQREALMAVDGPVFAYCASGTRSAMLWSFAQAGQMPRDEIIAAAAQAGYDLGHLGPQIDALAAQG